jgi:hypothetical protein
MPAADRTPYDVKADWIEEWPNRFASAAEANWSNQ